MQSGALEELRHLTRTTISAQVRRDGTDLSSLPGVHDLRADDGHITFAVDSNELGRVVAHLGGLGVLSLTSHPPTLEELFLRHYGDELAEAGVGDGAHRPPADTSG